jgi:NADH:ubiquinone oxidoreductase subunit 6 (subunit J)
MNIVLTLLLIAAMAATVYVLVRGVVTMAQGKVGSSEQQQQWMQKRVMFQAIAIVIVIVILLAAGASGK